MSKQLIKITHRKRYVKTQKPTTKDFSKDNELNLLGDEDVESFSGSHADLESAADNLFTSPPRPQPLAFESLSLKTPVKAVPPTPGTALQQKIESKLKKSLDSDLNIQLQQQMGVFQASMLEAMQSLRHDFQSFKKTCSKPEVEMDQTSASASKPGQSKQAVNLDPTPPRPRPTSHTVEDMEVDYGPSLPPCLRDNQSRHDPNTSDQSSRPSDEPSRFASARHKKKNIQTKDMTLAQSTHQINIQVYQMNPLGWLRIDLKHADKRKHKVRLRYVSSSSEEDQSSVHRHRSSKPSKAHSDQDQPQHDPDPPFYREVSLADISSQCAEEVDTFRRILDLPDPRETIPRSSTSVLGLDNKKDRQELRPRGPSSMLPLRSIIKDTFDKFEQDFHSANLPEGKYIKPRTSNKVGQPCYEDKIQELNTDFSKICITPKPSGAPVGKVPIPVLKELEHQARQNISTINSTAAFAKTSSSCNATLEKCQHSLKSTFKKVKSQIQKCANPERAARRGYDQVCEYFDIWNKTILIQH